MARLTSSQTRIEQAFRDCALPGARRILGAIFLIAAVATSWAQRPPDTLKTFTAADRVFQFKYSDALIHCQRQTQEDGDDFFWTPASCTAYIPICDDQGSQGNLTIACFAYSKDQFQEKLAFGGAAFSVEMVTKVAGEKDCLSASPGWVVDEKDSGGTITINGVHFKIFEVDGVGTSHSMDGRLYRTFHGKQCYQLSIRWMMTNQSVFDPEVKSFTKSDWDVVNRRLEQARDSFRFLK